MSINNNELRDMIFSDVTMSGLAAIGDEAGILNIIGQKTCVTTGTLPISNLEIYIDSHNLRIPIELAISDSGVSANGRYAALMTSHLYNARYNNVEITNPLFIMCLNYLVNDSVIPSGTWEDLAALCIIPVSLPELRFNQIVTDIDISKAMRGLS